LAGATGRHPIQLLTDRPRPAFLTFDGARVELSLPSEPSLALKALSRREGVTLFMTLLAGFKVLLHRYTGQEEIVVGTPIANRNRAEIEADFFVTRWCWHRSVVDAGGGVAASCWRGERCSGRMPTSTRRSRGW
jgi:hypothetical protein